MSFRNILEETRRADADETDSSLALYPGIFLVLWTFRRSDFHLSLRLWPGEEPLGRRVVVDTVHVGPNQKTLSHISADHHSLGLRHWGRDWPLPSGGRSAAFA